MYELFFSSVTTYEIKSLKSEASKQIDLIYKHLLHDSSAVYIL